MSNESIGRSISMQTRENEVTIMVQQILDQVRRVVVGKDTTDRKSVV